MSTSNSQSNFKEDAEDFSLPVEWKPGADLTNKMLLSDPKIMNMIIHSIADVNANSYSVTQAEWADGSRSDILYTSTESLPPILVESQYQVNQDLMSSLINCSSNLYKRYRMLPIVLVIATKSFSSIEFQNEFTSSSKGYLLEASCKFWAKQCFLLTADAVSNHLHEKTLDPMVALGYFLTHHTLHQVPRHHWQNPTLTLLSSTVKAILSNGDNEILYNSKTRRLLNQAKRNLEKIIEESDNQESSGNNKTKILAKDGLLSIEQIQKDLEGDDPNEEKINTTNQYTSKDIKFIEDLSEPGRIKKWKDIFDKGKASGLFQSYKSSDTLKSSYYHIKKRKTRK